MKIFTTFFLKWKELNFDLRNFWVDFIVSLFHKVNFFWWNDWFFLDFINGFFEVRLFCRYWIFYELKLVEYFLHNLTSIHWIIPWFLFVEVFIMQHFLKILFWIWKSFHHTWSDASLENSRILLGTMFLGLLLNNFL